MRVCIADMMFGVEMFGDAAHDPFFLCLGNTCLKYSVQILLKNGEIEKIIHKGEINGIQNNTTC